MASHSRKELGISDSSDTEFCEQENDAQLLDIGDDSSVGDNVYVVCPKRKCTDFPMYELATKHLVDVYRYVGSDLGCMSILVSTGLVEPVVCYCRLCMVVFYNLVTFAMQENIEQRYAIKFCVKLNKSVTATFASLTEA